MSSDLSVHLHGPVKLSTFAPAIISALKEILDVAQAPEIIFFELDKGTQTQIIEDCTVSQYDDTYILVKLEGHEAIVSFLIIDIPALPMISDDEVGPWAGVSVQATRSPLEFVLAASMAVALARMAGTPVEDSGTVWNPIFEQSAEDFVNAVRVRGPFDSLEDAAEAFWRRRKQYRNAQGWIARGGTEGLGLGSDDDQPR